MNEAIRFTILVLLCIVLVTYNPIFQLILVLVPAFYTALTHRNGILFSIMSFLFVSLTIAVTSNNYPLMIFVGILCTMGILVGEINYRKNDMVLAISLGALVIILNFAILVYMQNQISDINFVDYMLNSYFALLEENGLSEMVNYDLVEIKNMIRISMPSMIIATGIVFGVINYFVAGSLINARSRSKSVYKYFWEFSLPGSALVAVFVTIIGVGLADLFSGYSAEVINTNLKIVYSTLFFIQGLSVLDFLLTRRFRLWIRLTIYGIVIFTMVAYPFLITMGALDLVFNIRKLKKS